MIRISTRFEPNMATIDESIAKDAVTVTVEKTILNRLVNKIQSVDKDYKLAFHPVRYAGSIRLSFTLYANENPVSKSAIHMAIDFSRSILTVSCQDIGDASRQKCRFKFAELEGDGIEELPYAIQKIGGQFHVYFYDATFRREGGKFTLDRWPRQYVTFNAAMLLHNAEQPVLSNGVTIVPSTKECRCLDPTPIDVIVTTLKETSYERKIDGLLAVYRTVDGDESIVTKLSTSLREYERIPKPIRSSIIHSVAMDKRLAALLLGDEWDRFAIARKTQRLIEEMIPSATLFLQQAGSMIASSKRPLHLEYGFQDEFTVIVDTE